MGVSRGAVPVLIVLLSGLLGAQTAATEVHVQVEDPSGSPMEASGHLKNAATRADIAFSTDPQGAYTLTALPSGTYSLQVSREGFVTQTVTLDVKAGKPVSRVIKLALSSGQSKVDVVETMPLPGVDLSVEQVPVSVQTAGQEDIVKSGALDLPAFMSRRMKGVYLNEMQGNPFQADLNYRGYTASPLLGTPQGISVYLDGVRQNQPFGDVVSWDLIEDNAVDSMTLVAGSQPLFGLNTLGGAISIQSKDGVSSPGLAGGLIYGSSGRKALDASWGGGKPTGFNWFLAANAFHETGWRVASPSDVRQGFARFGWQTGQTTLALSTSFAYNTLTGNGIQDYRVLANSYSSVYTIPDTINNRVPAVTFNGRRVVNSAWTVSGNAYYRYIRSGNINGNINTNSFDESVYQPSAADQAALTAAGYTGFPTSGANAANTPFPMWRCIAQALQFSEPVEKCDALIVYSRTAQNSYGASGQATVMNAPGSRLIKRSQFTVGGGYDGGHIDFTQNTQFGYLTPDRRVVGVNAWEDGSTNSNGTPVDSRVDLHGVTPDWSLFASETLTLGRNWSVMISGRYNRSSTHNLDRLDPVAGPGSLTGDYVFERFNPSIGFSWSPVSAVNLYASYAQGSRAPTSIELGCADPVNPCSLPNALASDPPLKQVVTGTWEAGLRGKTESRWSWNVGAFRAENRDDILFVASQQTGSGYFKNFGRTLREGFDADVKGAFKHLTGGLNYTFLQATYQSTEIVDGTANNTSDMALSGEPGVGGVITIHSGNRIPLVPKQTGKAFLDWQPISKFLVDLNLTAASSSYARGNENNAYQSDGKYYLGPGVSPGYAVVNLQAHYDLTSKIQIVGRVDNLFDRRYYTAAQLGNTGLTAQGSFIARPFPAYPNGDYPLQSVTFFAPGAPRRAWAELRVRF
jgi:outer membrane receptor protein involved in Fe transport